jgi:hypothetical protein
MRHDRRVVSRRDLADGVHRGRFSSSTSHDLRRVARHLGFVVLRVRDDDDLVAGVHETGAAPVENHVAGATAMAYVSKRAPLSMSSTWTCSCSTDVGELHERGSSVIDPM